MTLILRYLNNILNNFIGKIYMITTLNPMIDFEI